MTDNAGAYTCPCCGYPGLELKPYSRLGSAPYKIVGGPPYSQTLGEPSFDVCDCCGFEFGTDDEPGTAPPTSFREYLERWVEAGCKWFDSQKLPRGWTLADQLRTAGIAIPTSRPDLG